MASAHAENGGTSIEDALRREKRLSNVLRGIRNVNQLIVHEDDPSGLADKSCANLTETFSYHNVWMALLRDDGSLLHFSQSGLEERGADEMRKKLLCGDFTKCIRKAMACDDVVPLLNPKEECLDCPLSSGYGGRAAFTRSLMHAGKNYGIISASIPFEFAGDEEEVSLFREVAGDIAFALHKIESGEKLRQHDRFFNHASDMLCIAGFDGYLKIVNPAWTKVFGWSADDLTGRPWSEFVHPDDVSSVGKEGHPLAKDGEIVRFENRFRCRDGSWKWLSWATHAYPDEKIIFGVARDITSLKRREDEVSLLGRMLDEAPASITVHDDAGKFLYANKATLKLHGYWNVEEFLSVNLHDLDIPASEKMIGARMAQIRKEGRASFEVFHRRKDGSVFPLHVLASVIEWDGGEAMLSIASDISERKAADQKLQELLTFQKALIDSMPMPLFYKGLDGKYLGANKAFYDFFGMDIVGRTASDVAPEDLARRYEDADRELFRSGNVQVYESQAIDAKGIVHDVQFHKAPFRDADGRIAGLIGVALDITESKKAADEIRRSNLLLSKLLDIARELSTALDFQSVFKTVRSAARGLSGADGACIVLREGDFCSYVDEDAIETLWKGRKFKMSECISGWVMANRELAAIEDVAKDPRIPQDVYRKTFVKSLLMAPVGREKPIGAIGVYWAEPHKPTEMEIALLDMLCNLTASVWERENLKEQLGQSQRLESVGCLAGGVAHDFNNMLGVIIGFAEMAIEKTPQDNPVRNNLDEIMNAAKRSAEITRQLLAFARRQTIAPVVLDINETLEGMLKMLRRLIGENIRLDWRPGPSIWPVEMDPSQIDQILANLCVNAKDAVAENGCITIETENRTVDEDYSAENPESRPGDYVMLSVSDDGCGMDKDTAKHIFEPFFSTKGVGKGTGLGLATVYGIVKQNNGFINVYSEAGVGTSFKIYLPRCVGAVAPKVLVAENDPPGAGEIILLVEDEPAILEMAKELLSQLNYNVVEAKSPSAALALAESRRCAIDLILTDVIMPEMNGRELHERLLRLCPQVKVLFMSGYTANTIAHHGVLDPDVNFIQKPFSKKEVAVKIRKALGK